MSDAPDQRLLEALLDSWDRNNAILLNLLRALPEGVRSLDHGFSQAVVASGRRTLYITLYLMGGLDGPAPLLKKLGKHKTGGACLYIQKLADVDVSVLEKLIAASVKATKAKTAAKEPWN